MKLPTTDAVKGYGITLFYIADFICLIVFHNVIYLAIIFGIVFLLGSVRLYFGAKNLKSFSFDHKSGFKVEYYDPSKKSNR